MNSGSKIESSKLAATNARQSLTAINVVPATLTKEAKVNVMKPITVLLAEDHTIVREGLRAMLSSESDIEVIAEASDGRDAVKLAKKFVPSVVVMDIAMPLLNGLEAARQILAERPATRVIVLSAHADDEYVDQAISLGATGYLIKQSAAHLLSKAIRDVFKGGTYFSPSVAKRIASRVERLAPGQKRIAGLTAREMEVLQLIAEGHANKQTAAELGVSIKTVEKHRQHLMSKLDIHDTAGLTRYAIAHGIIERGARLTIE